MNKCVIFATGTILAAWTASAQQEGQKVGAFLGYDYVHFYATDSSPSFRASGGDSQFTYDFNKWIGAVADVGAIHNGSFAGFHADTTMVNFMGGPRVTFLHRGRFRPFAQALFGGVWATSSTELYVPADLVSSTGPVTPPSGPLVKPPLPGQTLISSRVVNSDTAFAMTAGAGLDIRITRHLYIRPAEVDYFMTRLHDFAAPIQDHQNNLRYLAGLTYWFGGEKPAPQANRQVTKTCPGGSVVPVDQPCPNQNFSMTLAASPAEVCPGQTATLMPSFSGASPNQLNFSSWSVNGEQVSQSGSYEFQSDNRAPGTYTVKYTTGGNGLNRASAETTITVLEYQPPTGTVEANPAQISAGEKSTLSANFHGQCGGPIQSPTYQASEGTIEGDQFDSSSMQWGPGEQQKTVTITASAADNKTTGTATTTIEVTRGATAAAVRLPDVLFSHNSSRVNNCGKRILLEQLRAYYERDSSGSVVLSGHSSSDETVSNLAQQRVENSTAVITAGTGTCLSIPQTQVQVSSPGAAENGPPYEDSFCRSSVGPWGPESDQRRVEVWFVPSGAQVPTSVSNLQPASTLPISNLGCPR
jgi:outer membrane protein OmpA-like peptidoglycan-associated protein